MLTNEEYKCSRVAAAPPFPGLHRFPQGRRFKQLIGDDSKVLMKVHVNNVSPCQLLHKSSYLGVLERYLRACTHWNGSVHCCLSGCMLPCSLTWHQWNYESDITKLQMAIRWFHEHWETFRVHGVWPKGFSLPHQHSLTHYPHQIHKFGAPAGLCSSITKSWHIMAVKQPWRWSNHHNALGQMLLTNQRLDKLKAACNNFVHRGLFPPLHAPPPKPVLMPDEDKDGGPIDKNVTGTVTLARTRCTFKLLSLVIYIDFGHQNKRLLATLHNLPTILTDLISLNSHATFFTTKCILMALRQMK